MGLKFNNRYVTIALSTLWRVRLHENWDQGNAGIDGEKRISFHDMSSAVRVGLNIWLWIYIKRIYLTADISEDAIYDYLYAVIWL